MLNMRKIALMTKMAIYDKEYAPNDRKINDYYKQDYIYRKNFTTRICAIIGAVILLVFYWTHKIIIDGVDVFSLDYTKTLIDTAVFVGVILVIYSIIGTIKTGREYSDGQKRLRKYNTMIGQLERLKARVEEERAEEAFDLYYGADTSDKRNYY